MDRIEVDHAACAALAQVLMAKVEPAADADHPRTQSMAGWYLTLAAGRRAMQNARSLATAPVPVGCKAAVSIGGAA